MEAKGIVTSKGELNLWIQSTNQLIAKIRKKIAELLIWIGEVKETLSQSQTPNLGELLRQYCQARNAGAWSQKAQINNLKAFAEMFNYLTDHSLITVEDFETHITALTDKTGRLRASMKDKSSRMKELRNLIASHSYYKTKT